MEREEWKKRSGVWDVKCGKGVGRKSGMREVEEGKIYINTRNKREGIKECEGKYEKKERKK